MMMAKKIWNFPAQLHKLKIPTRIMTMRKEENDDGEEDLELSSTATQTEDTNTDNDHSQSGEDASKRIKELEDALKKAKAAEREARAEVIRKDIEISRAAINAQK